MLRIKYWPLSISSNHLRSSSVVLLLSGYRSPLITANVSVVSISVTDISTTSWRFIAQSNMMCATSKSRMFFSFMSFDKASLNLYRSSSVSGRGFFDLWMSLTLSLARICLMIGPLLGFLLNRTVFIVPRLTMLRLMVLNFLLLERCAMKFSSVASDVGSALCALISQNCAKVFQSDVRAVSDADEYLCLVKVSMVSFVVPLSSLFT